jgi:hypothetical protein
MARLKPGLNQTEPEPEQAGNSNRMGSRSAVRADETVRSGESELQETIETMPNIIEVSSDAPIASYVQTPSSLAVRDPYAFSDDDMEPPNLNQGIAHRVSVILGRLFATPNDQIADQAFQDEVAFSDIELERESSVTQQSYQEPDRIQYSTIFLDSPFIRNLLFPNSYAPPSVRILAQGRPNEGSPLFSSQNSVFTRQGSDRQIDDSMPSLHPHDEDSDNQVGLVRNQTAETEPIPSTNQNLTVNIFWANHALNGGITTNGPPKKRLIKNRWTSARKSTFFLGWMVQLWWSAHFRRINFNYVYHSANTPGARPSDR